MLATAERNTERHPVCEHLEAICTSCFEARINHIRGLIEALSELTSECTIVDRPRLYEAADAVLASVATEVEALYTTFVDGKYSARKPS